MVISKRKNTSVGFQNLTSDLQLYRVNRSCNDSIYQSENNKLIPNFKYKNKLTSIMLIIDDE